MFYVCVAAAAIAVAVNSAFLKCHDAYVAAFGRCNVATSDHEAGRRNDAARCRVVSTLRNRTLDGAVGRIQGIAIIITAHAWAPRKRGDPEWIACCS